METYQILKKMMILEALRLDVHLIFVLNFLLGVEALNSVLERLKVEFVHSDLDGNLI